jgi:hypothetical protein
MFSRSGKEYVLTSESHMRTVASSPAVMMVLFPGPHTALLILPVIPVITSADSSVSAKTQTHLRIHITNRDILSNKELETDEEG